MKKRKLTKKQFLKEVDAYRLKGTDEYFYEVVLVGGRDRNGFRKRYYFNWPQKLGIEAGYQRYLRENLEDFYEDGKGNVLVGLSS
jgi:hypothetical protein